MADQLTPSQDLAELFFKAMDRAFEAVQGGKSLRPFTMTVSREGASEVKDFDEDGLELARQSVQGAVGELRLYAIAGEGYVNRDGRRWDAILVEAGEEGQDHAFLFCQRCEEPRWKRAGGPEVIDRPLCLLARAVAVP